MTTEVLGITGGGFVTIEVLGITGGGFGLDITSGFATVTVLVLIVVSTGCMGVRFGSISAVGFCGRGGGGRGGDDGGGGNGGDGGLSTTGSL